MADPRKSLYSLAAALVLTLLLPGTAGAMPSFARQTGQACSACHVGSFGPQLTSFGRAFKLNGYTWGDQGNLLTNLSGMASATYENVSKNYNQVTDAGNSPGSLATRFGDNNNVSLDYAAFYYAGKLTDNIGVISQSTYTETNRHFNLDWTDIRYANTATLAGQSLVYGITLNNNPTVQDAWQSSGAWGFPYAGPYIALAPTPNWSASPYMLGLADRTGGAGIYALWNDLLYVEIAGYRTFSNKTQLVLGQDGGAVSDHLDGTAPYWRVNLQHDFGPHYVAIGTYGMDARRFPGNMRDNGSDEFLDYALDGTYQGTFDGGTHIVSVYGSALHEEQSLNGSVAAGWAANRKNDLTVLKANASYYYDNTYGVTVARVFTEGSADPVLYASQTNPRPNNAYWTLQLDYTPFGKDDSFASPYLNIRFFVQYYIYDKFNGSENAYNNNGAPLRNASDNNTLYTGAWVAF